MGNTDAIVGDNEKYLVDCEHPLKEASEEDIGGFCGHIKRVLDMLDGMLSILRKKHGQVGDVDYVAYEQSADQAMKIWKELGLRYTPSFHYLRKEALRLLEMHGGIGELLEDYLEQSHQKMDKIHQRLARLGLGKKRAMAISRLVEIANNPNVRSVQEKVRVDRKRNFKHTSEGAKKRAWQKVKDECRAVNLEAELDKVKTGQVLLHMKQ